MNIVKTSGITARTKSLRERFSSKRSMSELSFGVPSTSTSSLTASESSRTGSFRKPRSPRGSGHGQHGRSPMTAAQILAASNRQRERDAIATSELIKITGGDFASYMPEDAYSSALDINCQLDGEPRFPWQRDVAIQCDLLIPNEVPQILVNSPAHSGGGKFRSLGKMFQPTGKGGTSPTSPSSTHHIIAHPAASHLLFGQPEGHMTSSLSAGMIEGGLSAPGSPGFQVHPSGSLTPTPHKKYSHFSGLRFWKSSSPINPETLMSMCQQQQGGSQPPKSPVKGVHKTSYSGMGTRRAKSVLQRAVSFDSRGYSKLISNDSVSSLASLAGGKGKPSTGSDPTHSSINPDGDSGSSASYGTTGTVREFPPELLSPSKSEMTIITRTNFEEREGDSSETDRSPPYGYPAPPTSSPNLLRTSGSPSPTGRGESMVK